MNEMTKYLPDRPEYYTFALENARNCLEDITLSQGGADLLVRLALKHVHILRQSRHRQGTAPQLNLVLLLWHGPAL